MNGLARSSTIVAGIAVLALSTGVFAQTATTVLDPVTGLLTTTTNTVTGSFNAVSGGLLPTMNHTHGHEYMISNQHHHDVKLMDGVEHGQVVCSSGNMPVDHNLYKGDTITNLTTQHSGIITGIKHHGTMDVMGANGKVTRYQYITFKVKH